MIWIASHLDISFKFAIISKIIGKYIITPDVFEELAYMKDKVSGELGLDNAFNRILGSKPLYGYEVEGKRYDCGDKLGYLQATIDYGMKHPVIGEGVSHYINELCKK